MRWCRQSQESAAAVIATDSCGVRSPFELKHGLKRQVLSGGADSRLRSQYMDVDEAVCAAEIEFRKSEI